MSRPVISLVAKDLESHPLWEFAIDEEGVEDQDETWVRPLHRDTIPPDGADIIAADFQSADGTCYPGFASVITDPSLLNIFEKKESFVGGGVVFIDGVYTYMDFDKGNPFKDILDRPPNFFPLRYKLRVRMEGEIEPRSGVFE